MKTIEEEFNHLTPQAWANRLPNKLRKEFLKMYNNTREFDNSICSKPGRFYLKFSTLLEYCLWTLSPRGFTFWAKIYKMAQEQEGEEYYSQVKKYTWKGLVLSICFLLLSTGVFAQKFLGVTENNTFYPNVEIYVDWNQERIIISEYLKNSTTAIDRICFNTDCAKEKSISLNGEEIVTYILGQGNFVTLTWCDTTLVGVKTEIFEKVKSSRK
ncbi:hypothetical protein [Mesotoga prima]|uniref:hypothetical protein n=1 Tax=Mesotoga prima TaxID=1184387 RepID=UPI002CA06AD9|nr:hypothetical protein [Cyclobacteriaceae bacterium]